MDGRRYFLKRSLNCYFCWLESAEALHKHAVCMSNKYCALNLFHVSRRNSMLDWLSLPVAEYRPPGNLLRKAILPRSHCLSGRKTEEKVALVHRNKFNLTRLARGIKWICCVAPITAFPHYFVCTQRRNICLQSQNNFPLPPKINLKRN